MTDLPASSQIAAAFDCQAADSGARLHPTELNLKQAFFEINFERAELARVTRDLVQNAPAKGRIGRLGDGAPFLEFEGARMDIIQDESTLLDATNAADHHLYVVFGLGAGNTARWLRSLTDSSILIFEPEAGIVRTFFEFGPSDIAEMQIVCDLQDLSQIWQKFSHGQTSATLVSSPGYVTAFPESARALAETVSQLVQRGQVNDATHRMRSRTWVEDVLANVHLLSRHASFLALSGKYRNVPAFIVGAGPSLGKNGALLAEAARKGIVFAVNTSARALASYEVEPQVVACMESIDVSHLLKSLPFIDRCVRAFSLTAHPATLRTGTGPLLHVYEGTPQIAGPLERLTGFRGLTCSGSVSTLAFSLAQRLGCSPIVFVGQDLAYTDGKAYAVGTAYQDSRVRLAADGTHLELDWCRTLLETHNVGTIRMHEKEALNEVTAWGGAGRVYSGITFSFVRFWLEAAAQTLIRERPDQRLINATEGGSRIQYFEEATLRAVLDELPELGITAASLAQAAADVQPPLSEERVRKWADVEFELTERARRAARRVRRLASLAERSFRVGAPPATIARLFAELEPAERALRDAANLAPFVDAWTFAQVHDISHDPIQATLSSDTRGSAHASLKLELELAKAIEGGSRELAAELHQVSLDSRPQRIVH